MVTLGPASYRPSLTDDPQFDRFMALSLVGALLAAVVPSRLVVAAGLPFIIVVLEIGQRFLPGRHAQVADSVIKIAGALTGIGVIWLLQRSLPLPSSRPGAPWAAIAIGAGLITVISLATWYVISPERALQGLRHALVNRCDHTLLARGNFLLQPVPALDNPAVRRIIIGNPEVPLTTDIWGRSSSRFSTTLRTPDRTTVLLVLRFQRAGIRWLLVSVAPPDSARAGR